MRKVLRYFFYLLSVAVFFTCLLFVTWTGFIIMFKVEFESPSYWFWIGFFFIMALSWVISEMLNPKEERKSKEGKRVLKKSKK